MHRVAAVVVVAVLLVTAGCTSPADRAQMSRQTLASTAVEGARLARMIVNDHASATFARTHAQELADDVQRVQEDLADHEASSPQGLLGLADQVDQALGTMAIKPADHAVARAAEKTLARLASRVGGDAS